MNLTISKLKQIIKEEIDNLSPEPESPLERAERLSKQHDLGLGFGEINHLVDIILDNPEAPDEEIVKLVHAKVNPQMIGQSSDLPWGEAMDRMIEEEIKKLEGK